MRLSLAWRLLAISILLLSLLAVLPAAPTPTAGVALADNDDDSGQGNDDDDDDGDDKQGKDKKDKKDKKHKGNQGDDTVTTAAAYTVEVTCAPEADGAQTACEFQAIAPPDGKKVTHVLVPAAVACAEVVGGDADYVDPDPNIHLTGYRETHDTFTIIFDGTVTTAGTATYWVKAASEVSPATGPGLACDEPGRAQETVSTPVSTPAPETGTVVVSTYACTGVPADTTGYDWYGACTPAGDPHRYLLSPADDTGTDLLAAGTDDTGNATFADLPPGAYALDDADSNWCHAESDNVNADSDVVVTAGAETTVWLFYCERGS